MGFSASVICQQGLVTVPWEDTKIDIPLNFEDFREAVIYGVIRGMKKEIGQLQIELHKLKIEQRKCIIYKFKKIPNEEAKKVIVKYLRSIKDNIKRITIFEISQKLELPADQVEEILEGLNKEKKVILEE